MITVRVGDGQTGFVRIIVNGSDINVTVEIINGVAKYNATGLNAGHYLVNVTYMGDDYYEVAVNSTTFDVLKNNMTANVTGLNVTVEDNIKFVIDNVTPIDFAGKVKITVNGTVYDGDVKSLIEMGKLLEGSYTATLTFYGDNNYNNKTINVNFRVNRVVPELNVTIDDTTYPNKAVAYVKVSNMANGTVNITVDGKVFTKAVVNGEATVDITGLSAGAKVANVYFITSDKYNYNATTSTKFNVYQNVSKIIIDVGTINVGEDEVINITFNDDATGNVTVYVGDQVFNRTITDHMVQIVVSRLAYGNYTVVVDYYGDVNYTKSTNSTKFSVIKNDINVTVKVNSTIFTIEDAVVNITLSADINTTVVLRVNDVNYTVSIVNGKGKLVLSDLDNGTYVIHALFDGNEKYLGNVSNVATLMVNKVPTKLNVTFVDEIKVGTDAVFDIRLNQTINTTVTLRVGKFNYTVDLIDGVGRLVLSGLDNATYAVQAFYAGDDDYINSSSIPNDLKVNKSVSLVNVTAETVIYGND